MKKIIIVDDNADILDSLCILLEEQKYMVTTLLKGDETLKKALIIHPDLIILDLLLSGKDGCDIVQQLHDNPVTKDIPILMISAHPHAEKMSKDCGANDFLAKPFDIDDLLNKVKKYCVQETL